MIENEVFKSELLKEALEILDYGYSVIPVAGKTPLVAWKQYQEESPTKETFEKWFDEFGDKITGIGIVTGFIYDLAVVDIEKEQDLSVLDLPVSVTSASGGGGRHFYYKYPEGVEEIKSGSLKGIGIIGDIKADGGFIVAPPSQHQSGGRYEWIRSFYDNDLAEFPSWLLEKISKTSSSEERNRILTYEGVYEGERHTTGTKVVGNLLRYLPVDIWEDSLWPLFTGWNSLNNPPLPDKELRNIFVGISEKERAKRAELPESKEVELRPMGLKEILEMTVEDVKWTIDQLIPEAGLVVLSAPPAHNKTWLALYFAIQVAHGDKVFDRFETTKCNVLFVEEDTSDRLIIQRIQKLKPRDENASIKFLTRCGLKLDNDKIVKKLIELIEKENIGFVILDSLVQLHGKDENMNSDMAKVFAPLKKITDMGVSVLVLHHHRKESGSEDNTAWKDRSQNLRGASSILALINSHLLISRQSQVKSTLRQTKLWERAEMLPLEFTVSDENDKVVIKYIGELEPDKDKKTVLREKIVDCLHEAPATRDELVEKLKDVAGVSYIANAVAEMKRRKEIIVKEKDGRTEIYVLPDIAPVTDMEEKEDF